MDSFTDRITEALTDSGLKQADLARACGISSASVANWFSGATQSLRGKNLIRVSETLGVNPDWLSSGKGRKKTAARHIGVVVFDLLDIRAACGSGAVNDDYPETVRSIEMPIEAARKLIGRADDKVRIIRASKDSMAPTIQPDDLLFVDTNIIEYAGEGVYLLFHDGGLVCKRLQTVGKVLTVISDNDYYLPWSWTDRLEETRIIGKVLRALPMDMKNFGG